MGLDDEKFSVKRVDNTTGASVHTFLTFTDVEGAEGLGINEVDPHALVHISNTSSNQLRVTRKLITSTGNAYPTIQLETLTTAAPIISRIWSLAGPDFSKNDSKNKLYNLIEEILIKSIVSGKVFKL